MNPERRHEYLKAMGIDVWIRRDAWNEYDETEKAGLLDQSLLFGPGTGSTLFICGSSADAATTIAADLARCIDGEPVWAWPDTGESGSGMTLAKAIDERLFTRVLVFDSEIHASRASSSDDPSAKIFRSARLITSLSLPNLAQDSAAKKALWAEFLSNQWNV